MAERRMFSKAIISSGKFLRMPPTSRLLYYDLGMAADDDGVVEAYSVMTQTKATEDDLRVLVSKGYIRLLNEDLVSLITDWKTNNSIRSDRYHPSIYAELLTSGADNQLTTTPQPTDNQMETEDRLGKVRLVQEKNIEPSGSKPARDKPIKHKYGEYKNVLLSDEELEKLKGEIPNATNYIEKLSGYLESKGAKYKSHFATIRAWYRRDCEKQQPKKTKTTEADYSDFNAFFEEG